MAHAMLVALLATAFLGEMPRVFHYVAFALIVGGIVVSARRRIAVEPGLVRSPPPARGRVRVGVMRSRYRPGVSTTLPPSRAGIKALADNTSTFAHTQGLWRFLNNEDVTPDKLSTPLVAACHAALEQCEGDYALTIHDWSRIHYGSHTSKKDRLQMTHAKDIGYELQSSLLVNAQSGNPLSVAAQNLVSAEGHLPSLVDGLFKLLTMLVVCFVIGRTNKSDGFSCQAGRKPQR
jgi:hypothetical protein